MTYSGKPHRKMRVSAAMLALFMLLALGAPATCESASNAAESYMQRLAKFLEDPANGSPGIFISYKNYIDEIYGYNRKDLFEVPAIILSAMRGRATPASVMKTFFDNTPDTPWQPASIRSASIADAAPWGWIACSKGKNNNLWFALYKSTENNTDTAKLAFISYSEQTARKVGGEFAAWEDKNRKAEAERQERYKKEEAERKLKQEEEARLAPLKKNCIYNIREKHLSALTMSEPSVSIEENSYGNIAAKIRVKVGNNGSDDISFPEFAVIICNKQGIPVFVGRYSINEKYQAGQSYWLNANLNDKEAVLAAMEVAEGHYSINLSPVNFRSAASIPTEYEIERFLKNENGRWTYQGKEVSTEAPSALTLAKFTGNAPGKIEESARQMKVLQGIRADAERKAKAIFGNIKASCQPSVANKGNMTLGVTVHNSGDSAIEYLNLNIAVSEGGAIVQEMGASFGEKIPPAQSRTVKFNTQNRDVLRLYPDFASGKAAINVTVKEARVNGKMFDSRGTGLIPQIFR